jgi:hypothetical protein
LQIIADEATIRGILSGKAKNEMLRETDIRKIIDETGLPFSDNAIKEIYHSIITCIFGLGVSVRSSQTKAKLKILEKHADGLLEHAQGLEDYLKFAVIRTGGLVIRQAYLYELDESYILALDKAKELARVMKDKSKEEIKNVPPDKGGNEPHIAINMLIRHIAAIYKKDLNEECTIIHNSARAPIEYYSPCFDLLTKIFNLITKYTSISFKPSEIGSAATRVLHLTKQKT